MKAPGDLLNVGTDLLQGNADKVKLAAHTKITSIDNMTPSNRFVLTLVTIPVAPQVAAHSIIAVKGEGPVAQGNDGVVAYKSAHIDGVESELVVHLGHSAQGHPPKPSRRCALFCCCTPMRPAHRSGSRV